MSNPLVSIIIPVYKVEQYLHRCVDSVINQSYKDLEIILVDDGSPDNCPNICNEYTVKDRRIKVVHKVNGGLSSARNAALDLPPKGEFIFFLDSDDFLHHNTIEELVKIQQKFDADIVQCRFYRGSGNSFPKNMKFDVTTKEYDNTTIFYSKNQSIALWGGLYRTSLWNDIRMPIGKVNEDDATAWKLYYKSRKTVVVPAQFYYYYINPNSIMSSQKKSLRLDFIDHYNERIDFFKQNGLKLHTQLSQWRFCLPLMLNVIRNSASTKEQRKIMWCEFKENYGEALRCSKVPLIHKMLFVIYRVFPRTCRFFGLKLFKK